MEATRKKCNEPRENVKGVAAAHTVHTITALRPAGPAGLRHRLVAGAVAGSSGRRKASRKTSPSPLSLPTFCEEASLAYVRLSESGWLDTDEKHTISLFAQFAAARGTLCRESLKKVVRQPSRIRAQGWVDEVLQKLATETALGRTRGLSALDTWFHLSAEQEGINVCLCTEPAGIGIDSLEVLDGGDRDALVDTMTVVSNHLLGAIWPQELQEFVHYAVVELFETLDSQCSCLSDAGEILAFIEADAELRSEIEGYWGECDEWQVESYLEWRGSRTGNGIAPNATLGALSDDEAVEALGEIVRTIRNPAVRQWCHDAHDSLREFGMLCWDKETYTRVVNEWHSLCELEEGLPPHWGQLLIPAGAYWHHLAEEWYERMMQVGEQVGLPMVVRDAHTARIAHEATIAFTLGRELWSRLSPMLDRAIALQSATDEDNRSTRRQEKYP